MSVKRHFLGWDTPANVKVSYFLISEQSLPDSGTVDLSGELIVVPTRQAGRRLRETMALYCSDKGLTLLPPQVVTPVYFLRPANETAAIANQTEIAAIWTDVLMNTDTSQFAHFFRAKIPQKDFTWALHTGDTIQKLRDTLADGKLRISDVFNNYKDSLEELERWNDLSTLETAYLKRLYEFGLKDPAEMMINQAQNPQLPKGIQRVSIAAIPDPTPLMIHALQNLSGQSIVKILVHAPETMIDYFDEWGRPVPEKWQNYQFDIPESSTSIILTGSPASQSQKVLEVIASQKDDFGPSDIAIAIPDNSVASFLSSDLNDNGLIPFDPSGKSVKDHPIYQLLSAYRALVTEGSYDSFSQFLRNADVLDYLQKALSISSSRLLEELDDYQNRHLPMAWENLSFQTSNPRYENLSEALSFVRKQAQLFQDNVFDNAVRALLQTVYQIRTVNTQHSDDEEFIAVAELINTALEELSREPFTLLDIDRKSTLELFLRILSKQHYYQEPANARIDLEGWLELPWNDAPLMIVTGMNEGIIPDGRPDDVFLPDTLRKQLNLRHDSDRLAADTFLICGLVESRRENGRVYLIAGKTSSSGDPLKPSRLLFRCRDEELPERARRLFGDAEDTRANHPANISFKLVPPDIPPEQKSLQKLSVTAFKDYLKCPFRFYLKHLLKMESIDDQKTEMNPMDFGLLIHDALNEMARNEQMRQCDDEQQLKQFLHTRAENWIKQRFGPMPSLPVQIQLGAAKQRLAAAARVQARQSNEGWQIRYSEMRFETALNGMNISGRIDRIDQHIQTGQIRILDYKTTDTSTAPEAAHLGSASAEARNYARIFINDKEKRWIDLQLPLYQLLASSKEEFASPVLLGYFNLPKAVTETDIVVWESFNENRMESAKHCIEGIIEDIQNHRFWPPASKIQYDDFESLFHIRAADCIDTTNLENTALQ